MNICVFCSSRDDIAEPFKQSAYSFGEWIAEHGHTLIYGGATGGLMSSIAEGAASRKGEIIGVIADPIIRMNRLSKLPTALIKVKNLSERKDKMKEIADIFVILSGGIGTMDEMFDVLASGSVGEHNKPLIVLNQNGFYNGLVLLMNEMKKEKCIPENQSYTFTIVQNREELTELIHNL
ncbi:TIGR00730 family Rossman fold protein [Paludibacteraceae bacterium OttesenSCG-928-F17]|nr:TIGR00730 family Rossman fold protein [Paludibacteraceae bacterium OttesenSCG-928-F17]